jgi:ferric-dicitrate binding protein FerR (iron transport regulator)
MTPGIDPERLQEAAAWRARLADSPESHSVGFTSWLAEDPR